MIISVDIGSLMNEYFISRKSFMYNTNFVDVFEDILEKELDGAETVKRMMLHIEKKIERCCKGKSFYDLLYTSRRIRASNVFKMKEIEIIAYRSQMTLAFAKYCNKENEYKIIDNEILPVCYYDLYVDIDVNNAFTCIDKLAKYKVDKVKDLFEACYEVEKLCAYYIQILKTLRTLNKGAHLRFDNNKGIASVISQELGFLTSNYDERAMNNQLLSKIGGHALISPLDEFEFKKGFCLCMQENVENISIPSSFFSAKSDLDAYVFNYVPIFVDLRDYYFYASNFEKEFHEFYGFELVDFIVFISIIGQYEFSDGVQSQALLFLCRRAYKIYENNQMKRDFVQFYEMYRNFMFPESVERNDRELNRIFGMIFESLAQNSNLIYLNTITSPALFYQLNDLKTLVDYTSWVYVLENILSPVVLNKNSKGFLFEDIVAKKIRSIYGSDSIIFKRKKMKSKSGVEIEIDVAFEYKNILIIADCKAVNRARTDFLGTEKSVQFRKRKFKESLDQVDKTAKNLLLHFSRDELPAKIIGLLPILITSSVEYIWSLDSHLWISENFPRIISIDEIDHLKRYVKFKEIKNKDYFMKVNK